MRIANCEFRYLTKFAIHNSKFILAERVGFEPTERFPVHSISSAASSTTPAPLQVDFEMRISKCGFRRSVKFAIPHFAIRNFFWRRGWDSNPRRPLSLSGFRDRCTNPLCDLSASYSVRLLRKNSCISARHSTSKTPALICIRWFRKSVSQTRNRLVTAPARSSGAP